MNELPRDLQESYDRVAAEYTSRIADELEDKPFDRTILDRFAARVRPVGTACDLGCGPGHVARYLHQQGLPVTGVDLSPGMVREATQLNPEIPFRAGSMLALPFEDASLGGIAAFYSIIHIPPVDLPSAFREMFRVLRSGGSLLVAFHIGDECRHLDEWWGFAVSMDFYFFCRENIEHHIGNAGFTIIESTERDPYPEVEHQSRRAYILAEKTQSNRMSEDGTSRRTGEALP